ncbi:hypothetical protein PInf_010750 [Phytophthora infestans]|nr:hypothetical protein PInf_010750 [Phytophthora infestans]
MTDTVKALKAADDRTRSEYVFDKTRIGVLVNRNYDEKMSQVLKFTSHFVAEHVEKEYVMAIMKVDIFKFDTKSKPGFVAVTGKHKVHFVQLDTWNCTCSFACAMRLPCQHAISYRKWSKIGGSIIPLNRIDERWLHPVDQSVTPRPFVVNEFKPGQWKQKAFDAATKYKEALNATQAICSELADIESDDEYHELLQFVLDQWRNIRQRKRLKGVPNTESANEGVHEKNADTVASPEILKIHDCETNAVAAVANRKASVDENGEEDRSPPAFRINLNPKAAKSGRPRSNRKDRNAEDKKKRAIFNESEAHRRRMGEVSLVQLACNLQEEKPCMQEFLIRVQPIPIKFERAVNKKPKYVRLSVPILNETAFYLLPMKLLQKCVSALPVKNTPDTAISVFSQIRIENAVTGRKMKTFTETIKAKAQMLKSCAETLFIPVNSGNTHWCGIIVDVKGNQVMYYDPMNQKSYNSVLDRMSWDLAETLSDAYQVLAINSPI